MIAPLPSPYSNLFDKILLTMSSNNHNTILKIHQPKPRFPVIREIKERFSPRFFSNKPVNEKDLKVIFEAARWAPSGHNTQPWHFYFTPKGTQAHQKLFSTLEEYNQSWSHSAPLLILATAITKNNNNKNTFAHYDLGAAVFSLILQAQSLGYYSRQMGLFDKKMLKKIFKLKASFDPYTIIAMGTIGNFNNAPQQIIDYELDPRPRKTNIAEKLKLPNN